LIRPWAKLSCLLYFRKIFLIDVDKMPRKGPLMIVCNHPSSFFEACLMAVMLPRPLYFLTRGDFFKNPLFAWFLGQTHQVPIFRAEDGFDKLRSNKDTFGYCYAALKEKKVIIIFPESRTETEKRLRPIQKGAGRIALGALERMPDSGPLQILPIGITFSDPTRYRSLVTLRCGDPISVETHEGDERAQIAEITVSIQTALRSLIIHIEERDREALFDVAQELLYNERQYAQFPVSSTSGDFPQIERNLESVINALSDIDARNMSELADAYRSALRQHHLKDRHLFSVFRQSIAGRILLLLIIPLIIIGKLVTFLPAWGIHRFVNTRIRRIPFHGPTKWALGQMGYGLLFTLGIVAGIVFFGALGGLIAAFFVMAGFLNLQYFHDLSLRGLFSLISMSQDKKTRLLEQREKVLAIIRAQV
jgi:1-acyl-sn-glycerol-3-phosphate acyltransferase